MSILVCGGAGYIGSHFLRVARDAGYECLVFDNLSTGHRQAIGGVPLIVGDLLHIEQLREVFATQPIEAVVHFAAFALVGESVRDPLAYYENNVSGTLNLLKVMREAGVKHLIFSSSCAVYGEACSMPIRETAPANPCNPYGHTKHVVEQTLAWCERAYALKSVCLRYFNAAGAMPDGSIGEDHALETHLIPLIFKAALRSGGPLNVFGADYATPDGSCVRDYIHVLDLAGAHIKALAHLLTGGDSRIYNLGTGQGVSVLAMIKAVERVTGAKIPYVLTERRAGDPPVLVAAADKARQELRWQPNHSDLDTIIHDAWAWHSTHPHGYADR